MQRVLTVGIAPAGIRPTMHDRIDPVGLGAATRRQKCPAFDINGSRGCDVCPFSCLADMKEVISKLAELEKLLLKMRPAEFS